MRLGHLIRVLATTSSLLTLLFTASLPAFSQASRPASGKESAAVPELRDLQEQRLLERDSVGRWLPPKHRMGVPTVVRHIIVQRVARLGEDAEWLLRVASVVGQEWQLTVVEEVLSWDEARLLRALEAALDSSIIVPGAETPETYRFAHALLREVLYGELVVRRRKQLHRQVVSALEARKYKPALLHGKPLDVFYTFTIRLKLPQQ